VNIWGIGAKMLSERADAPSFYGSRISPLNSNVDIWPAGPV
jgi:hypothetical protein